jgi:hypothetical protein
MSQSDKRVRRVAFGDFASWAELIRPNLDARYAPSFVDLSQVRLEDFDAVIPIQLTHYTPLFRHPELRGLKFFHPSPEVVSLCDDKLRLTQFLIAQGFASFVPPLRSSGAPYPYVRKKREGWWGMHCHIVRSPQDECGLDLTDDTWFSQALVPGQAEFATHILRVRGQIRYASTFIYEMATPEFVKGAVANPFRTGFMPGCVYLDLFSEILARLEYEGTACIDYKIVDGQPVVFEINPRFGGSLSSDVTAYLDAYLGALARPPLGRRCISALTRLRRGRFAPPSG